MTGIIMDFERKSRCGVEEAVFCRSKTSQQIDQIIIMAVEQGQNLLLTHIKEDKYHQLSHLSKQKIKFNIISSTATLGELPNLADKAQIAIVSGGSSDAAVCQEISITLNYHGIACDLFEDIGVAGLWRLTDKINEIKKSKLIIAVAGMEAALPTVLAGMVAIPIIAVPTSIGYGVSKDGHLALNACLGSCAPGILTVNIDNGFGAACSAIKILKSVHQ